jgi:hypothetical protein
VPRAAYAAVLTAAVLCYAALGAVLRVLPALVDDPAALGLLVGAGAGAMMSAAVLWRGRSSGPASR